MRKPFNGNFPQTQGFGENPATYAKFKLNGHNGLDFGLPSGTPVIAPASGGFLETVIDGKTGLLYGEAGAVNVDSLMEALQKFDPNNFD